MARRRAKREIWVPDIILEEDEGAEDENDDFVSPSPAASATSPSPAPSQVHPYSSPAVSISPAPISSPSPSQPPDQRRTHQDHSLRKTRRHKNKRRRKKRSRSMRKLVRTMRFIRKWTTLKDSSNFDEAKYDKFLKKGYKRVGRRIVEVPPEDSFFVAWFKRNFPLDPTETFVYWYVSNTCACISYYMCGPFY